ncbi:MAG: four helix bundle protein [Lentisphaeria bacterium]|nr:four helix bundle protein [Lentisphaeria bacterium]
MAYVSRITRFTLLAPEIIHGILSGQLDQIGRAGTSIGANIHEAQYAHGKADFVSKLQITLKEANETSYWLLLLGKTNILSSAEYDRLETLCREIRITLIASINTTKQNLK